MLKLYPVFFDSDSFSELDISRFSQYRREKIAACRSPKTKNCRIAATLALEAALSDMGLCEKNMQYSENEYGKPYFKAHPEIYFSVSHTDGFSVAAVSDSPIGIDCERSDRKISRAVLNRFFSDSEVKAFENAEARLWTAKESYTKLYGIPFAEGAKNIEIPYFEEFADAGALRFERKIFGDFEVVWCYENKK